jgi:hypothetical protein
VVADLFPGAAIDVYIVKAAIERQLSNPLQKSARQIVIESHLPPRVERSATYFTASTKHFEFR